MIDHVRGEVERDIDAVMATLVTEPQFHVWSAGRDIGPKGRDAVRAYYDALVADAGAWFESRKDRIVVDHDTISHEGPVKQLLPGPVAARRGYTIPDQRGHYLVQFRNVVWWSFDDAGLALGEDAYATLDLDAWERVDRQDLPQGYLDYLAEIDWPVIGIDPRMQRGPLPADPPPAPVRRVVAGVP